VNCFIHFSRWNPVSNRITFPPPRISHTTMAMSSFSASGAPMTRARSGNCGTVA